MGDDDDDDDDDLRLLHETSRRVEKINSWQSWRVREIKRAIKLQSKTINIILLTIYSV